MRHYRLALLGFGNVGKAFSKLLLYKQEELTNRFKLTFSITGIATAKHGVAVDPMGLDLSRALVVDDLSTLTRQPTPRDSHDFIQRCGADVLFENTPVNYKTGQPAIDHLRVALESGMHVITANKGPVVHGYQILRELAEVKGRKFFYESTVMDGAPIFSLFRESLPGANLLSIRGVLNSTTNLILSRMEQGESFDDSIKYCQKIGISETDPSGDIDGHDAAIKLAILTMILMDFPLKLSDVNCKGIREIGPTEIKQAQSMGKRWKLVCHAERKEDGVETWVSPEMIEPESPLYHIQGTSSIVQFETDVLGLLTIIESDPSPQTTAYGLFADFLNITSNPTL